jgi:hypothetical protein
VSRRTAVALAACVSFRVVLPLAVLAAAGGRLLPGFPRYDYEPTGGDAYGYYYAVRELLATGRRELPLILALLLAGAAAVAIVRRRSGRRVVVLAVVAWTAGCVAAVLSASMHATGAGAIGWPLVWAVPLLPLAAVGVPLDPDSAFSVGLALSIVANVVTVLALFRLGRLLTGRAAAGVLASAAFAFWPLIALAVSGSRGTANGTWQNDVGLSAYTEPLSTALVCVALLLVAVASRELPRRADARVALAGVLLGYAVVVRLSNVVILAVVLVWLLRRLRVYALWAAGAAAAFAPVVLAFWQKGYFEGSPADPAGAIQVLPGGAFSLANIVPSWEHSLFWRAGALVFLLPLAALGTATVERRLAALLAAPVLANTAFYTPYRFTPLHPRFLFVGLPPTLALWSAGAVCAGARVGAVVRAARRAEVASR